MLQEHHQMTHNGMQRNPRLGLQQMGPPPNQRTPMLMSMPATGVLVSMSPGPGPALLTTTSLPTQPQQPPQPKPTMQPQVYHYETAPSQPPPQEQEQLHQQQSSQQQQQQANQQQVQQQQQQGSMQQHMGNQQEPQQQQHNTTCPNTNTSSITPNNTLANIKEKTPMCLVNELARYNKIQHQYRLTGEAGPAHKKIFTVTLKLGNEEYEAEGPSIKKAQHSAAAKALTKTELKHPPPKTVRGGPGGGGGRGGPMRGLGGGCMGGPPGSGGPPGGRIGGGMAAGGPGAGVTHLVTPTVELNALAMKRGERTVYVVESGGGGPPHQNYMNHQGYYTRNHLYPSGGGGGGSTGAQGGGRFDGGGGPGGPAGGFDPSRRGGPRGAAPLGNPRYPPYEPTARFYGQFRPPHHHVPGDPYTVRLRVGEREYPGKARWTGHGYTVQAARHDAAAKAIEHIKQMSTAAGGAEGAHQQVSETATNDQQLSDGAQAQGATSAAAAAAAATGDLNADLKSPISLVYEIALKRNLNVIFDVLSEKGPPHMKVFVTQCRVGTFVAEGEGNGKKISKKRAAEKMLEELSKLPALPNVTNLSQLKRKRVTNKKKTRNLIKVVNMDKNAEGPEEINPISRLIQRQQANKEREPVYTVLEERGAPRRREFVIEASVNGHSCTGVGPNKKVAKRNAAEALLAELGYAGSGTNNKPASKNEKEPEQTLNTEKNHKAPFPEEKQEVSQSQPVGGSGGRQLVPGVLFVSEQNTGFSKQKMEEKPIQPQTQLKNPPQPIQGVRSKDQLLYLAQLVNIQVQFSDFPKANHEMYLTLVSLGTNPPQVCHGEGPTTEASHEKAALEALKVLSELGLDIAPNKEGSAPNEG